MNIHFFNGKTKSKIKPVERLSRPRWKWSPFATLIVACGLAVNSCGTIKPIPVETNTEVHIKDSLVLHIKDSVRITERSIFKDYAGLLDTLRISNGKASMTAWADTSKNIINGSLETKPQEEKTRIVYRDRWKVRDSLVYKEVPVEVEKPVEVIKVPWIMQFLSGVGIVSILIFILNILLKVKFKKI